MNKKIIIVLSLFFISIISAQSKNNVIYIASYNLENLFDTINDPEKNDEEYLPSGAKEWTDERLETKMYNLSRVIRAMNNLNGPDILGVQEVENKAVLQQMLDKNFCDKNYKIAYANAPDKRGIDNGLIYNADKFELKETFPIEVILDDKYPTRLILYVQLNLINNNNLLHLFVNHWPSRRGGQGESEHNRLRASETLRNKLDEIFQLNDFANIVILGDFNDEPNNNSITSIADSNKYPCSDGFEATEQFYNLAIEKYNAGLGTYLYKGDWNMLDQIIISRSMVLKGGFEYNCFSFELIKPNFIIQQDGNYKGASLPTYGGRKYFGGFSDHFAVGASFIFNWF